MLISAYIGTIPVSGDAEWVAEHSMSGMLPSWIPVSTAMIAKAGAAERRRQLDTAKIVHLRLAPKAVLVVGRR